MEEEKEETEEVFCCGVPESKPNESEQEEDAGEETGDQAAVSTTGERKRRQPRPEEP